MNPERKEATYKIAEKLRDEQSFVGALIFGSFAMILGAGVWAAIGVAAGYIVGYVAIALGVLVGLTIQLIGRGIDTRFSVLACVLAVLGCLCGNLFWAVLIEARIYDTGIAEIVGGIELAGLVEFFSANLTFVDVLFWILAIGAAGYLAKRRLSREEGFAVYTLQRIPNDKRIVT